MMATSRRRGCAAPRVVLSISPRADSETRPSFSGTPPKASSLNLGGVVSSSMARLPRARWVFPQLFPSNTSLKRGAATNLWRFAVSAHGATHGPARGEMLAQISTGLVQLHSRYYGKGPTKAKTHWVDDTIVCILRGGFTTVERTLLDTGQVESVYQMRRSFQGAMEAEFRRIVEDSAGRHVIAYMSSINVDPELAVEIFVLEPVDETRTDGRPSVDGDGAAAE